MGLYYNVLIELFAKLSWDDKFGCLVCASQPLNIILPFVSPLVVIYQNNDEKLVRANEFICHVLYFPFAAIITMIFTAMNVCVVPFGYATHVVRLLTSIIKEPNV